MINLWFICIREKRLLEGIYFQIRKFNVVFIHNIFQDIYQRTHNYITILTYLFTI